MDQFLQQHPDADGGDVLRKFGFSPAKTNGMAAWATHMEHKEASEPPPKIRERQLTKSIAKWHENARAEAPEKRVDDRDPLFRKIIETATAETRAKLNRLKAPERNALLDYVLEEINPKSDSNHQNVLEIMVALAESWLEKHEQNQRQNQRAQKGQRD